MGPLDKETFPEKVSVFSYNSAFKPILNKSVEDSKTEKYQDINLNLSFEKLSNLKKRNFLLNPSLASNSKPAHNFFRLDNTLLKPKVIRLWENSESDETYEKRLLSQKRKRYDLDDYARFSPEYETKIGNRRKDNYISASYRTSRLKTNQKDKEIEEKSNSL